MKHVDNQKLRGTRLTACRSGTLLSRSHLDVDCSADGGTQVEEQEALLPQPQHRARLPGIGITAGGPVLV
jgi:hypothetical protein